MKETKRILKNILSCAQNGKVVIGGQWAFYVKINTEIEDDKRIDDNDHLILNIPDFDLFAKKVHEYLKVAFPFYQDEKEYFELDDEGMKERLIMFLLINMSRFDAANIDDGMYEYIEMRTNMLKSGVYEDKYNLGDMPYNSGAQIKYAKVKCGIKKALSNLEAPYKMTFYFENDDGDRFVLPTITFGIADRTAYVYAVQNDRNIQQGRMAKDLDRYFRKLNKNVDVEDVIANVSPSALAALTLFVERVKKIGAKKIVAKDFLPCRYFSVVDGPRAKQEGRLEQLDRDQFNATNKFMYLFLRYSYHFPNCNAEYDEYRGEMHMPLKEGPKLDDNIIYLLDEFGQAEQDLEI